MTEQEIYEGIARKDNAVFLHLYETYQDRILRMVQKNNGNAADARDIFQEGLIALWTNVIQGKFQLQEGVKVSSYLYTLCRNLWISRLRRHKHTTTIEDNPKIEATAQDTMDTEQHDRIKELGKQFAKLGDSCQRLLKLFYFEKASMREIAEQLDLTEKTAKNNKYRCMQQLRAIYQKEK